MTTTINRYGSDRVEGACITILITDGRRFTGHVAIINDIHPPNPGTGSLFEIYLEEWPHHLFKVGGDTYILVEEGVPV